MSKWKFSRLLSFAMSATLVFTSVVPAHAAEELLLDEELEVASFAEESEEIEDAELLEEPGDIPRLMAAIEGKLTFKFMEQIGDAAPTQILTSNDLTVIGVELEGAIENAELPAVPDKVGYTKARWSSSSEAVTIGGDADEPTYSMTAENASAASTDGLEVVLTAKYTEIAAYEVEITFNANGGELAINEPVVVDKSKAVGTVIHELDTAVTKSGYTFDGWTISDTVANSGDAAKFEIPTSGDNAGKLVRKTVATANAAITLTAKWKAITQYKLVIPENDNYSSIEWAAEADSPSFTSVSGKGDKTITVPTGKKLYIRLTPKTGYEIDSFDGVDNNEGSITVVHVTAPAILNIYGNDNVDAATTTKTQVYEVTGLDAADDVVRIVPATAIKNTITLKIESDNTSDSGQGYENGIGLDGNKIGLSIKHADGTTKTLYDGEGEDALGDDGDEFTLAYGDVATLSFLTTKDSSYSYSAISGKLGSNAIINVSDLKTTTGQVFSTVTFTVSLTGIVGNDKVTIFEKSKDITGTVDMSANVPSNVAKVWTSADGEDYALHSAAETVKKNDKLYVKFQGTNGYVYNVTSNANAIITAEKVDDKGRVELAAEKDKDGKTIYVGYFTVENVYEDNTITIAPVVNKESTVTIVAAAGDGAAKGIKYAKYVGSAYETPTTGTTFKAIATDVIKVDFTCSENTIYTVSVDGNDAKVANENPKAVDADPNWTNTYQWQTGSGVTSAAFYVTGVAADVTITITASKNFTFVIVDDEDAGFAPLLTFTVDTLSGKTIAEAIDAAVKAQGAKFDPRKTGYYYDHKLYNKDTEVAGDAVLDSSSLAATGAVTTLVVHYSADVYTIRYYDSEQTVDGSAYYDDTDAVATQSDYYGNKKPANKAGENEDIRAAVATYERTSGYKFAKSWRIFEAEYYDAKGNRIADLTGVSDYKVKYVSRGVVDDQAILSTDLSTTNYGSVYVVPVYEDVSYTINFADAGVIPVTSGSASSKTIKASEMNKSLPESMFSAVGYDFAAWALPDDGGSSSSLFYPGSNTYGEVFYAKNFASSVTLYPTFTLHSYTITYHDLQSATPEADTYTYGTGKTLAAPSPMSGFSFVGWYYDAEYKKAVANNVIPSTSTGDIDVYAKYEASDLTIVFEPNYTDATAKAVEQKIKNNIKATLTANSFTRTNYEFAGWSLTQDGPVTYLNQASVSFTSADASDGKIKLYAVWAASGTEYTVTLDLNGGKATATDGAITGWTKADSTYSAKYTYGTATTYPTLPTATDIKLDNYELAGWTLVGSGEAVTSLSGMKGNFTLKAKWTGKTFKVTYNSNSSKLSKNTKVEGKMSSVDVKYGDTWAPLDSAFTAKGYTFQGWAKTADSTTAISMAPSAWEYTENQTLYAIWKADSEVLYLYSAYGKIDEASYKLGTHTVAANGLDRFSYAFDDVTTKKIALPTKDQMDPDANGLSFKGWYKSAVDAYGNPTFKPGTKKASQIAIGDETVYVAKWTGSYTITFHNGADETTQKMTLNKSKALKANKFKESGFIFTGWDVDQDGTVDLKNKAKVTNETLNKILGGEPELLDYDLYAVFVPVEKNYNLTILDSSNSVIETTTFNYKKGLAAKNLKKLGKNLDSNFNYFVDSVTGKKVSKIKAKTAGDQTLILVEKTKVVKTTLVFAKNAPSGIKVTGSVSKKTVKSNAEIVKNVGKFKAKGLKVDYFEDATFNRYYLTPNGSMYLNAGPTHDGPHITDAYVGGKVTLTAHWTNANPTVYEYYYNLGAADASMSYVYVGNYGNYTAVTTTPANGCVVYSHAWAIGNNAYVLPTPTRAGYKFAGWTEQNASGKYVKTTAAITTATTRNLVATWTPIE